MIGTGFAALAARLLLGEMWGKGLVADFAPAPTRGSLPGLTPPEAGPGPADPCGNRITRFNRYDVSCTVKVARGRALSPPPSAPAPRRTTVTGNPTPLGAAGLFEHGEGRTVGQFLMWWTGGRSKWLGSPAGTERWLQATTRRSVSALRVLKSWAVILVHRAVLSLLRMISTGHRMQWP